MFHFHFDTFDLPKLAPPANPAPSDIPIVRMKAWAEVARDALGEEVADGYVRVRDLRPKGR